MRHKEGLGLELPGKALRPSSSLSSSRAQVGHAKSSSHSRRGSSVSLSAASGLFRSAGLAVGRIDRACISSSVSAGGSEQRETLENRSGLACRGSISPSSSPRDGDERPQLVTALRPSTRVCDAPVGLRHRAELSFRARLRPAVCAPRGTLQGDCKELRSSSPSASACQHLRGLLALFEHVARFRFSFCVENAVEGKVSLR